MPAQRNKSPIITFIKYWVPVIIYAFFIFCLSSVPGEEIPQLFTLQEPIFHVIEYFVFALLLNRAIRAYSLIQVYSKRFLWVFSLVILYALSDEFHQAFVPNRFPSLYDVAYDGIGAFMANIFYPLRKMLFSGRRLSNGVYR